MKNNYLFSSESTEIKPNQNKAVGIRATHIVRRGFFCKQRFFNVLILLRCFVLFLANGFSTCKNYIEYLSQRHQFHLFHFTLDIGHGKIMIYFLLNKHNQNIAVIKTMHIVRQGLVCKHQFFNVLILLRFFVLFIANGVKRCQIGYR